MDAPLPHVVFIAGEASHGYGEHEHNAGGALLVEDLNRSGLVRATLYRNGWPEQGLPPNPASIVFYLDGDGKHDALPHLDELSDLMARGVGLVAIHYATHVPESEGDDHFTAWLGGYYHSERSTNPHWQAVFEVNNAHPVGRGVAGFTARDEFYFNIQFDAEQPPTRVLQAVPPDAARQHVPHPRRYFGFIGGSVPEEVAAGSGQTETIAWALERKDGGRGFGFTGGHFHWNWANPAYRKLVLNGIAWTAGADIPAQGITPRCLDADALQRDLDEDPPRNFSLSSTLHSLGINLLACNEGHTPAN